MGEGGAGPAAAAASFTNSANVMAGPGAGLNGAARCSFQMPLHYPRYSRRDYEEMPEWKLDCLLREYGLPVSGDVGHKRSFAMGAFLWKSE
ncbi:hypothetical protein SAY87_014499 [Trapa incisa]|uniref:DUF7722 domain-containing protein n=2 Tax=Trapa TaxID=22665 RepID=A0AAN7MVU5_TRANT|nr:hypothetical protein SAY87_014499 [Trapa incisa]KAK4803110.1 hypothetical protein SAY86_001313 [Trapa natans]